MVIFPKLTSFAWVPLKQPKNTYYMVIIYAIFVSKKYSMYSNAHLFCEGSSLHAAERTRQLFHPLHQVDSGY